MKLIIKTAQFGLHGISKWTVAGEVNFGMMDCLSTEILTVINTIIMQNSENAIWVE